MRSSLLVGIMVVLVLGVGSARGEEVRIAFVKVTRVKEWLEHGRRIVLVDVRSFQEYLARHIVGAVSIPLNAIEERSREIPRQGIVILY